MKRIGILFHPKITASRALATKIADWLTAQGRESWIGSNWGEAAIDNELEGLSLLVVLGGDGSMLRAARLAAPWRVPLFGINLGRVGFLCESTVDDWPTKLGEVVNGRFWLEARLMLHAEWRRADEMLGQWTALNDVVVSRGQQARVVRLKLLIDGDYITTYTADGLIVATPTGSTAYSMAAGGPILPPELENFLVLPVAAHLSLDRALVLPRAAVVKIQVTMDHEATFTADGQAGHALGTGDEIVVRQWEHGSHFARVGEQSYFYRTLLERLGIEGSPPVTTAK